jgi:hypothetical protein
MSSPVITVSWPDLEESIRVAPLEYNQDVFDWFGENLKLRPTRAVQIHTLVSGRLLYWLNLPFSILPEWNEDKVVREDLKAEPIGRFTLFMPAGRSCGGAIKYGEVTEAMSYPGLGQVVDEDLDKLPTLGRLVWDNLVGPKKIFITEFTLT